MKKTAIILIIFFSVLNALSAGTQRYNAGLSRGFIIEGGVGKYNQVFVSLINNVKDFDLKTTGVPFNITAPNFAYTPILGGGRHIGNWSIATNYSNVTITISATDLVCDVDKSHPLKYYINFHVMYASYNKDGTFSANVHKDFLVPSGSTKVFKIDNSLGNEPFPVVSYDQDIRVYLAEGVNPEDEIYPYGFYQSNVTIQVSGD